MKPFKSQNEVSLAPKCAIIVILFVLSVQSGHTTLLVFFDTLQTLQGKIVPYLVPLSALDLEV